MEEYSFDVEHRPGVKHLNADALSRRPCRNKACACQHDSEHVQADLTVMNIVESVTGGQNESDERGLFVDGEEMPGDRWTLGNLKEAQENDPDCSCISLLMRNSASAERPAWESVSCQSHDVRVLWSFWPRLRLHQGLLERRYESPDGTSVHWQVIIPVRLREEFLSTIHGGMTGGHLARRRTAAAIQSRAYWPSWSADLDSFLSRCEPCTRYYRGKAPRKGMMQTPLVGGPWVRASVDISGPFPRSSKSNQYILTMVDHFSKFAFAIPLRCHTAPVVARALIIHVFSYFGAPIQILTDRGPEFESELFRELLRWMEIEKIRTTVFRPSTNGVVERFHRTLNSMLAKSINDSQRNWDERLPLVLAAYRASVHESTGFTPNRLFLGREVRLPIDLAMGLHPDENPDFRSTDDYLRQLQCDAAETFQLARSRLRSSAIRRKKYYDIKARPFNFKVGDWVWQYYPRRFSSRSPKWSKSYRGPFLIVRAIEPVNYVLQRSPRAQQFVVHVDSIKKCFGPTPDSWLVDQPDRNGSN